PTPLDDNAMSQDALPSPEEIDPPLTGPGGDDGSAKADEPRAKPSDPASQQRVIRARSHRLATTTQRYARPLPVALINPMRPSADITVDSVRYQSFKDFARNLPVPTILNLIAMKPLRGTALVVFPPGLVFMVVDNLFGGDGRFLTRSEGREFTNTEQRIIRRVLRLAIDAYQEAWSTVFALDVQYLRSEIQAKFANITNSPNEIVVNTTFHLEVGNLASDFQVCIPYSMIEPLRDVLTNLGPNGREGDQSWTRRMAGELRQTEV